MKISLNEILQKMRGSQATASIAAQTISTTPVAASAAANTPPPSEQPGAAVQPMPVPPPPPPPVQTPFNGPPSAPSCEGVLGVMVLRKPKSLGRYDSFTGVVTSQRMILAQLTSEMMKQSVQMARDQAKANGKGFFGQWSEQLKASFGYAQRYFSMAPSAILSETPGNYAVDNNAISEIKIKHKDVMRGGGVYEREFEMELHSTSGKIEFKMDENDQYINLLKQVYGERVKMPLGYFSSHGVKLKIGF